MFPPIRTLLASGLFASLAVLPGSAQAQYMYLDANGDGVHTDADVLAPSGATTVDIWLVTDRRADGSDAVCGSGDGDLTINSYSVIVRAVMGAIDWGTYENALALSTGNVYQDVRSDSTHLYAVAIAAATQPPGTYRLGRVTATVAGGSPSLVIAPVTNQDWVYLTLFGSECSGTDYDYSIVLNREWGDTAGLAYGGAVTPGLYLFADSSVTLEGWETRSVPISVSTTEVGAISVTLESAPEFVRLDTVGSGPGWLDASLTIHPGTQFSGVWQATVMATDGVRESRHTVQIHGERSNRYAPVFAPLSPQDMLAGTQLVLPVVVHDEDGDPLALHAEGLPLFVNFQTSPATPGRVAGTLTLAPGLGDSGAVEVSLVASDGMHETRDTLTCTVRPFYDVSDPVTIGAIPDLILRAGATLEYPVSIRSKILAYGVPPRGFLRDPPPFAYWQKIYSGPGYEDGQIEFYPAIGDSGVYPIELVGTDGVHETSRSFTLTVLSTTSNRSPEINLIDDVTVSETMEGVADFSVVDLDGDPVTFRIVEAPSFAYLSSVVKNGPSLRARMLLDPWFLDQGDYVVIVVASDSRSETRRTFRVHVLDYPILGPQVRGFGGFLCVPPSVISATSFQAVNPNGLSVVKSVGGLPNWITYTDEGAWGVLTFDPTGIAFGSSADLTLNVTDSDGVQAQRTMRAEIGDCPSSGGAIQGGVLGSPPVARAGGPYHGVAGAPIRLDGSKSFAPTGGAIHYLWSFGWPAQTQGPIVEHVYPEGGTYAAVLITGNGYGSTHDTAWVSVADAYLARAYVPPEDKLAVLASAKRGVCVRLEAMGEDYALEDVDPAICFLKSAGTGPVDSIACVASKELLVADRDRNGKTELEYCFARDDLRGLFAKVQGRVEADVTLQTRLLNGARVRAPFTLTVLGSPGRNGDVAVHPNPLNPEGAISFETSREGRALVRVYDVRGRLVRTLLDRRTPAGPVTVPFDGRDGEGRELASGVYFYRVETMDGERVGRLTILK